MTRKIDKEKYERILKRIAKNETQKSIIIAEKCSYGTISAAKQWDKMGRPTTITTIKNTSTNRTKIVVSLPNFWLERLNEDIVAGIWTDYSDAVIDIIRTYFRTRMEDPQRISHFGSKTGLRKEIMGELRDIFAHIDIQPSTPSHRKEIIGELKDFFAQVREYPRIQDDSIPSERVKHQKNRNSEFKKEIDLIKSSFKGLESENYTFINYHEQPLIKEEYDVLLELEKEVGIIPKWDYVFGEMYKPNEKPYTFCYSVLGNHIVALIIMKKGLTTLPKSINQLKYLHALDLRMNKLTDLPESIGQLEYLDEFSLQNNALKSLPETIGKLTNLRIFNLENNNLTALPDTFCNIPCYIELSNNKIASIDKNILEKCKMDLTGNPIMDTLERNLQETNLLKILRKERKKEIKNLKK